MTYQPEPLDTSSVVLDDSLLDLTERLARHTHDVWAQERLRLGIPFYILSGSDVIRFSIEEVFRWEVHHLRPCRTDTS